MTFKEKWNNLPQWLQVAVYTVLGIAAMAGVGYVGYRLLAALFGGGQISVPLSIIGAVVLLSIVFGGFRGSRRVRKRKS